MGPGGEEMGMSPQDSNNDLDSLEETRAILSDPVAMEQIRESERSLGAGEPTTSLVDLRVQLEHRRRGAAERAPRAGGPGLEPG
jgi:hypothetical protein